MQRAWCLFGPCYVSPVIQHIGQRSFNARFKIPEIQKRKGTGSELIYIHIIHTGWKWTILAFHFIRENCIN